MSINNFVGVGRLTRDPELRYTGTGVAVTNFTIAMNRPFKSNDGQDADFLNCVAFRGTAENLANYMRKGSRIGAIGRIQSRSYENKEGQRVYVTELVADSVQFLESKSEQGGGGQQAQQDVGQASNQLYGEPVNIKDSDLPF